MHFFILIITNSINSINKYNKIYTFLKTNIEYYNGYCFFLEVKFIKINQLKNLNKLKIQIN